MTQVRSPPDKAYSAAVSPAEEQVFAQVVDLIRASRERALPAVNSALIDLYWKVGDSSPGRSARMGGATVRWRRSQPTFKNGTPVYAHC